MSNTITLKNSVATFSHWQLVAAQANAIDRLQRLCRNEGEEGLATPEVPESAGRVAKAGIKHLSSLFSQLVELRQEDEVDDYGTLRLNEIVFNEARDLLINTAIELASSFGKGMPHGCASTDEEGGLRFEWFRQDAGVNLVIPSPNSPRRSYIFYQTRADHGTDIVSAENLAKRLSVVD
jgi:hypothetical protein